MKKINVLFEFKKNKIFKIFFNIGKINKMILYLLTMKLTSNAKKNYLQLLAVALISIYSCKNENENISNLIKVDIINCPYNGLMYDMCFVKDSGFIVGEFDWSGNRKSVIIKTFDGCISWQVDTINLYNEKIEGIDIFNDKLFIYSTCVALNCPLHIYYSDNFGKDWTLFDSLYSGGRLYYIDTNEFLLNTCGRIEKTYDGGKTWIEKFRKVQFFGCIGIDYWDKIIGYASGGDVHDNSNFGLLYKTVDGGETWSNLLGSTHWNMIEDLFFINKDVGFLFTIDFDLYKTTDGGEKWTLVTNNIPATYLNSYFLNQQTGFLVSDKGIFSTTNGGTKWENEFYNKNLRLNLNFKFFNQNTIFLLADDGESIGYIIKLTIK